MSHLADQSLRAVESGDERVHEEGQVGQQGAESHRHRQAQLHKQVLHVLTVQSDLQVAQS